MKRNIGTATLVFGAVLGLAMVVAVQSGWGNYLWDKYRYGTRFVVGGRCFELPPPWTKFPGSRGGFQDIRRHFASADPNHFVSVIPFEMVAQVKLVNIDSARTDSAFTMYEFEKQSMVGSLRYLAVNEAESVALVASRSDLLEELIEGISVCR